MKCIILFFQETFFGTLDLTRSDGILSTFETVLANVYHPAIQAFKNWGDLNTTPQGRKAVQQFVDNMGGFITYLLSKFHVKGFSSLELLL